MPEIEIDFRHVFLHMLYTTCIKKIDTPETVGVIIPKDTTVCDGECSVRVKVLRIPRTSLRSISHDTSRHGLIPPKLQMQY